MLADTAQLLQRARRANYGVGAFNIYNLEGATAVVQAAEELSSPVILQLLPQAIDLGGRPLIAMCLSLASDSRVEVAVHLDHCSTTEGIDFALQSGITSIMADGSDLSLDDNIRYTRRMVEKADRFGAVVEAELGRLSGEEDGVTVTSGSACMTDPREAALFVKETGVAALAVCIGNVHGSYHRPPLLDLELLAKIAEEVSIPLVLHGTSGLPDSMIGEVLRHGVCKFNVNTEIRTAYLSSLAKSFANPSPIELVPLMQSVIVAMKRAVQAKIILFCSTDRTSTSKNQHFT